ncbi:shikimate kinase [Flavicella sp.]|uniref:shikimate kinase n=1 Tax=Flavicella sp. TaxID=2957742 RepID=UPI00261C7C58|nr:shikimate kinase [Flavicella sp.]MDG1806012.1 shikimate kinase [Flavicella sp.]MDG2279113.1 shikimate kinase [Flavicella sp.]
MIVVLIGYMGSGKSSIGRKLSKKTGYTLVDLDDFIVEKEEASVKEIFESKGEIYFRQKEEEYLIELLQTKEDIILSLGGGTPCFGKNMDLVLDSKDTKSIYLRGSVPKLTEKLFLKKSKRPLIANIETKEAMAEFIGKHLFERSPFYSRAEFQVSTDNKTKKEVAQEVFELL